MICGEESHIMYNSGMEDFVNLIIDRNARVLCTVGAKTAEKNFTFLHLHAGRKGEIIIM